MVGSGLTSLWVARGSGGEGGAELGGDLIEGFFASKMRDAFSSAPSCAWPWAAPDDYTPPGRRRTGAKYRTSVL